MALRPKVGWAVRGAERLDILLACLAAEHTTFPKATRKEWTYFPADLAKFYHQSNGAELFGRRDAAAYRILPVDTIEPLDWDETQEEFGGSRGPHDRIWHRFAWLADGSWLALNLDLNRRDPRPKPKDQWINDPIFLPICHGCGSTQGQAGRNPVVAVSFTEWLERALDSGGKPYWEYATFNGYGDAEAFTRRK